MGELNKRVNKFAADLDNDFDALLRVVRVAEKYVEQHDFEAIYDDGWLRDLSEALEALPENLR